MQSAIPGVELIDPAQIDPSPTNPRKTFDAGEITELAEDLKLRGLLQFPIVRPRGERFELVIGERRWRAAKQAELELIPCTVREMSDREVLEAQIVENAKRSDVPPLEEAEAYHALIERHGYSAEDVAAKVGKSRATVYQRLQLRQLDEVARGLLAEGKLLASQAVLLARIPRGKKLQDEAAKTLAGGRFGDGDPLSFRESRQLIEDDFMLRLSAAPWPLDDGALVAGAPACIACPMRTGNQPELFEDVASPDVCTDPNCFASKRKAFAARRVMELRTEGARLLKAKDTKAITDSWGRGPTRLKYDAPYVALDARCADDPKSRTYRKLLKPAASDLVVAVVDGELVEMLPKKGLAAKLKAAGVTKPTRQSSGSRSPAPQRMTDSRARDLLHAETARRVRADLRTRAVETWGAWGSAVPAPPVLRWLAGALSVLCRFWDEETLDLFARRSIEIPKRKSPEIALAEWIRSPDRTDEDLIVLIAELGTWAEDSIDLTPLEHTCVAFDVDLGAIQKAVLADADKLAAHQKNASKEKPAKKGASKKAPAKKKAGARRAGGRADG